MSFKLKIILGLGAAAAVLGAAPAAAHPGPHGQMTEAAWLQHLLSEPSHAPLGVLVAGLLLLLGFDLLPRLYRYVALRLGGGER